LELEKALELGHRTQERDTLPKQKKVQKNIAHAKMVWAREQLQAAKALEQLEAAMETIRKNSEAITADELETVEEKYEEQKKRIEEFILKARDKFVIKVGPENVDAGLDFMP
jgi:hypothetical protein